MGGITTNNWVRCFRVASNNQIVRDKDALVSDGPQSIPSMFYNSPSSGGAVAASAGGGDVQIDPPWEKAKNPLPPPTFILVRQNEF